MNKFKKAQAIGLTLAAGLLTKSFFVPISAALIGFLALRLWRNKKERDKLSSWLSLIAMASTTLFIGGGWYLFELINHGVLSGHYDAIRVTQNGGLLKELHAHFTPDAFLAALVGIFADYTWIGSRSFVQIHPLLQAPLLVFLIILILRYKKILEKVALTDFKFLPVWLFTFLSAWVIYLVVYTIAGAGPTPLSGGYVHILMPLLAPALGASLFSLIKDGVLKSSLDLFLSYAALFQIIAVWSQMALFAGCSVKGINGIYAFKEDAFCLSQAPLVVEHLSTLGFPALAVAGFGIGLICTFYLVKKIRMAHVG